MADDVILETHDLTKEFRGFVAVNGVKPARAPRRHPDLGFMRLAFALV